MLRTRNISFTNSFLTKDNNVALEIYVPIVYHKESEHRLVGIIQLAINAEKTLFPLLQAWTTSTPTTEVLLLHKEEDSVLILNPLRHPKETTQSLRLPLSDTTSIESRSVVLKYGELQGYDYRKVPVLAATRAVPGTNWIIVAKVDQRETLAALRHRAILQLIIILLLISITVTLLLFNWYHTWKTYEIRSYQQQLEREALIKHFDYLAKYANDIIILCDEHLRIIECNDRARQTYGFSLDSPFTGDILRVFVESEREQVKTILNDLPADEGLIFKSTHIRPDNTTFPVELSLRKIAIRSNTYLQFIIRDITEREQAVRDLAASEVRYRTLVDASPSAIFIVQNEQIVYANPFAINLLNVNSEKALIGISLEQILDSAHAPDIRGRLQKMMAGEQGQFPVEDFFIRADGGAVPVEITAAPCVYNEQPAIQLIALDISEQLQDRLKIMQLNQQLALLIQVIKQLAQARQQEEITTIVVSTARRLTDSDGASFIFKDGEECFYAEEDTIEPLWKGRRLPLKGCYAGWAIEHKESAVVEDVLTDKRIPLATLSAATFIKSLVAIPINRTVPRGAIEVYWSHLYKIENDLLNVLQALSDAASVALVNVAAYQELEKRVAERTMQLEQTNKELEAFSYSVSHDLQAPLRAIEGYARMLLEDYNDQLPSDAQQLLAVIRANTKKMSQLIKDLLTFSRAGRKAMIWQMVNIKQLFADTYEELRLTEPNRQIDFKLADLPPIPGDTMLLKQVVVNLLSNALKFTRPCPEALIEVGYQKTAEDITIFVKDNGVGFDMRYVDKIFGVFQRLHHEDEFEGTGLGLALVQRIIAKHDGKVWIQSELNQGTTVFFSLPLHNPNIT